MKIIKILKHCRCLVALVAVSFVTVIVSHANGDTDQTHGVSFSFENKQVNSAVIKLYESDPSIWKVGQLQIVGACYIIQDQLEKALPIFLKLHNANSRDTYALNKLGYIYFQLSQNNKQDNENKNLKLARDYYSMSNAIEKLPQHSLKTYAVIHLAQKDIEGLRKISPDLIPYVNADIDFAKILLSYCSLTPHKEDASQIYEFLVKTVSKKDIDKNEDLKALLVNVYMRLQH